MSATPLYNEFPSFLKRYFPYKVQKISLNAGFTCPNRDGSKGYGGCTYCNNQTFNPDYCRTEKPIALQLEEGKRFFAHKYPEMKYLAYFQAYTNTYGELESLKRKYEEALAVDGVVGLVIGTRPDCMPDDLLRYLENLNKHTFLLVEYGIESTRDETLRRINRGHTFQVTVNAVERTAACGILTGGHVILDLVVDYVEHLRPDIVLERFVSQSPKELLIAPDWGLKNYEFNHRVQKRMKELDAYQGKKYEM